MTLLYKKIQMKLFLFYQTNFLPYYLIYIANISVQFKWKLNLNEKMAEQGSNTKKTFA